LFYISYRAADLAGNGSKSYIRYVRVSPDPCVTSLSELNDISNLMKIYPNPSTGVFNFKLNQVLESDLNIAVYDIHGKEIARKLISGKNLSEESIDLSAFSNGIYILKLQMDTRIYLQKLQID
jgi:hypothetical protein